MHKGAPKLYFAMKRRQKKPQSSSHQPNKEKNQQHAAIVDKKKHTITSQNNNNKNVCKNVTKWIFYLWYFLFIKTQQYIPATHYYYCSQ